MRPSTAGVQPGQRRHTPQDGLGGSLRLTRSRTRAVLGISSAIGAHLRVNSARRSLMPCVELTTKNVRLHFAPRPCRHGASAVEPSRPTSVLLQPRVHARSARCGGRRLPASVKTLASWIGIFTSSLCLSDIRHRCRARRSKKCKTIRASVTSCSPTQTSGGACCVVLLFRPAAYGFRNRQNLVRESRLRHAPSGRAIGRLQC